MRVIDSYNTDQQIKPCPVCLRNMLLTVAAALQLEIMKSNSPNPKFFDLRAKLPEEAFAEAAKQRMLVILEAIASTILQ
jgi:hypothetical protein